MWAVKVDGFTRAEFRHFASAAEFVEGLPSNESEAATIVAIMGDGEHELRLRLLPVKRLRAQQIRNARQTKLATRYDNM